MRLKSKLSIICLWNLKDWRKFGLGILKERMDMIVSICCKEVVGVMSDYFMCEKCGRACDTICALNLEVSSHDDSSSLGSGETVTY